MHRPGGFGITAALPAADAAGVRLLWAGDRIPTGVFPAHSRFDRAWNFLDGDRLISVVTEDIGAGPLSLVVSGLEGIAAEALVVDGGFARLGNLRLDLAAAPKYRSDIRGLTVRPGWTRRVDVFERCLLQKAAAKSLVVLFDKRRLADFRLGFERVFADRALQGAEAIASGNTGAGAGMLRGLGFGLTPSGDDFLAGLIFGLHLAAKATARDLGRPIADVHRAARGRSVFSNTLLELAREGLFFARLRRAAAVLLGGREDDVADAVDALLSVGASSGADLAAGLLFSIRNGETLWR